MKRKMEFTEFTTDEEIMQNVEISYIPMNSSA